MKYIARGATWAEKLASTHRASRGGPPTSSPPPVELLELEVEPPQAASGSHAIAIAKKERVMAFSVLSRAVQ
jgi:hypothetical protein